MGIVSAFFNDEDEEEKDECKEDHDRENDDDVEASLKKHFKAWNQRKRVKTHFSPRLLRNSLPPSLSLLFLIPSFSAFTSSTF